MCSLLLLAFAPSVFGQIAPESLDVLRAIENGYAANRASVEHGKARFTFLEGSASSPEAARLGEITDLAKAKGIYVFDGSRKRYELLFEREDVISHTSVLNEHQSSTSFTSDQVLTDGKATLHNGLLYNPFRKAFRRQASIRPGIDSFRQSFRFPLNLGAEGFPGQDDIADYLERARNHAFEGLRAIRLEQDSPLEGRKVYRISFDFEQGERTFWVDYHHGCLPVQIRDRTAEGKEQYAIYYDQVTLVGGRLWLPMRMVRYMYGEKPIIRVLQIDDMDVDVAPSDRDFQLSFAEPTTVLDAVHGRKYLNRTFFSLSNLARPDENVSKPVTIANSPPPAIPQLPGEMEARRPWTIYICLFISLLLVMIVGYRIWYRRRP